MKRILLISMVLVLLGVAVSAQLPPRGNALYADGARSYSACCPIPPGFAIAKIEMWVWCLPSENGLWGVDFAVGYPSNIIRDRLTYNGHLAAIAGDPLTGVAARFDACQWNWCWVAHQRGGKPGRTLLEGDDTSPQRDGSVPAARNGHRDRWADMGDSERAVYRVGQECRTKSRLAAR